MYLATSEKSNASYKAIGLAQAHVQQHGEPPVPLGAEECTHRHDEGYGKGYAYDHDAEGQFSGQECMPLGMEGTTFYVPGNNPREQSALAWLKAKWGDKYDL